MKKNIVLVCILIAYTNGLLAQANDLVSEDITSVFNTDRISLITELDKTKTINTISEDLPADAVLLLPPERIDIEYNKDTNTVNIYWISLREPNSDIDDFLAYKSCSGSELVVFSEIPTLPDPTYKYTASDKAPISGCEYFVAARNKYGEISPLSTPRLLEMPVIPTSVVPAIISNISITPTKESETSTSMPAIVNAPVEVVSIPALIVDKKLSIEEQRVLQEKIKVRDSLLQKPQVIAGRYIIDAAVIGDTAKETSLIEIYIKKDNSSHEEYVGKFILNRENKKWEFIFDTQTYPNGTYLLIPRGASIEGSKFMGEPRHVKIENRVVAPTIRNTTYNDDLIGHVQSVESDVNAVDITLEQRRTILKEEYKNIILNNWSDRTQAIQNLERLKKCYFQPVTGDCATSDLNFDGVINAHDLEIFKKLLERDIEKEAERTFDKNIDDMTVLSIQADRDALLQKKRAIAKQFGMTFADEGSISGSTTLKMNSTKEKLEAKIDAMEGMAQERKEMLNNRVQADVFKDADSDGISNFDEINIYKTDPFIFDSDGDGVGDGAEIESGFNPLDKKMEAVIKYQEARDAGLVNADIFAVRSVKAVIKNREITRTSLNSINDTSSTTDRISSSTEMVPGKQETSVETTVGLEFEGIAPPNSFVTLYIYSTPIIVTVKTDSDGNWSYIFDKELEDGDHEVYVAMTDNMGQVYMKSNPLNFVKEAQAITYEKSIATAVTDQQGFFNQKFMYTLILSIMAIIGIFLMFLGSRSKQKIDL